MWFLLLDEPLELDATEEGTGESVSQSSEPLPHALQISQYNDQYYRLTGDLC